MASRRQTVCHLQAGQQLMQPGWGKIHGLVSIGRPGCWRLEPRGEQGLLATAEGNSDGIHPLVVRITTVAFDMGKSHSRQARLVQFLPEITVEHVFAIGFLPPLPLPGIDPLAEALNHVLAVGADGEIGPAWFPGNALQQFQGGLQLHAVVGGVPGEEVALLLYPAVIKAQKIGPTPGAGITDAGPVTGSRDQVGSGHGKGVLA